MPTNTGYLRTEPEIVPGKGTTLQLPQQHTCNNTNVCLWDGQSEGSNFFPCSVRTTDWICIRRAETVHELYAPHVYIICLLKTISFAHITDRFKANIAQHYIA